MAVSKKEFSAIDAAPVVLYALRDTGQIAYPVLADTGGSLKILIVDPGGKPAEVDNSTHSLQIIDYQHHEIHSGSAFFIDDYADLSINNVYDMQFTTPNSTSWVHFTFKIDSEAETLWQIYETVGITVSGSPITLFNHNRNSATTSGSIAYGIINGSVALANADTNLTGSTLLMQGIIGAGRTAGAASREEEVILKQNTTYCFRAVATAAGFINFALNWYEHTDKN